MIRRKKSDSHEKTQRNPAVVAVVAPVAGSNRWRGLAADRSGGALRILDVRELVGSADASADDAEGSGSSGTPLHAWLDQWLAGSVLVLIPSASVIVRTLTLPAATPDRLSMALRLQVENVLLGGTPRHRAGAGMTAPSDVRTDRHALLVEWPETSPVPELPAALPRDIDVAFAPGIASLAALADGSDRALLVDLDRTSGCVSIALMAGSAITFRVVREDASDADAWREAAGRAVAETLLLAGVDDDLAAQLVTRARGELATHEHGMLSIGGPDVRQLAARAAGAPDDAAWWQEWGLLAGAALASTGELAPTARLRAQEMRQAGGVLARIVERCSEPRTAGALVAAAIAAAALLPMGIAGLRVALLEWKLPDPEAYERSLRRTDQQLAMYRDYERYAWPMTKLLGDLSSTTPEGIELESVSMGVGSPVTISGAAKPQGTQSATDAILLMERQMRDSGVFDRVVKNWDAPNQAGIIKFTLTCTVAKPSQMPAYPEIQDFAKRTLRDRRYGPESSGASASAPAAAARPAPPEPDAAASPVLAANPPSAPPKAPDDAAAAPAAPESTATAAGDSRSRRGFGTAANDAARRGSSRPASPDDAAAVPDPLSDADIAAMSKAEASQALARVSKARNMKNLDPAVEQRLKDEFYKLINHQKTAK